MSTSRSFLSERTAGRRLPFRAMTGAGIAVAALGLSSCGGDSAPPPSHAASVSGRVMGGQLPVTGATVSIYAAGNQTPLLSGTTDANGMFQFNSISCPSSDVPVYVVSTGGDAGMGANTAIALSAGIASCSSLQSSSFFVNVDEVTTVASVWALSQFFTDASAQHLGAPAGPGVQNAALTIANLADTTTGLAATALVGGTSGSPPTATVNTLANILATCVNAAGPADAPCVSLFAAATPPSGTAPTTTLEAALNIARNPGFNVSNVYALNPTDGPFQTSQLTAQPNDWTLSISFEPANGGLGAFVTPSSVAIDKTGMVWVTSISDDGSVNGGHGFLFAMTPQGVVSALEADSNMMNPGSLAIDQQGQLWLDSAVVNGTVQSFDSTAGGSLISTFALSTSLALANLAPEQLTIDASGNVWIVTTGAATNAPPVVKLSAAAAYAATGYDLSEALARTTFVSIAADSTGNIWLGNQDPDERAIVELPAGYPTNAAVLFPLPIDPGSLAVDTAGNIWNQPQALSSGILLEKDGASYTQVTFGPSSTELRNIATDGGGDAWLWDVFNAQLLVFGPGGVSLPGMGTSTGGLLKGQTAPPSSSAMAIDASGNVWIPGGVSTSPSGMSGAGLVEVVGAAVPKAAPLIAGVGP